MANQFSNFSLVMVNLWIGMCRGVAGLPRELRQLGYEDKWIEYRFSNSSRELVEPDLIVASEKLHNTLLLEWKGGANTDEDQLRRYSLVTAEDLRDRAFVYGVATQSHDVTLVGLQEYEERLKIGLRNGSYEYPVLIVESDGLRPAKQAIERKIQVVLQEASRKTFREYIRWNRTTRRIEILSNPVELQPDKRTAAYRKLQTLQKKFIEALRVGKGAAEQLELFPLDDVPRNE